MIVAKQTKITSKGQVTIPVEVRNALGLHEKVYRQAFPELEVITLPERA